MALTFLCPPFPEETFYSVAARACRAAVYKSSRSFAIDLTGVPNLNVDLGVGFEKTQADFVEDKDPFLRTTQTRFLVSFVNPPIKRSSIYDAITAGESARACYLLGRTAARRRNQMFYRYCPACRTEQIAEFGESFWTQLPQISGFTHCPKHRCCFVDSTVRRIPTLKFTTLDELEETLCPIERHDLGYKDALIDLSSHGIALFDFNPTWDTGRLNRAWWRLLRKKGYDLPSRGLAKHLESMVVNRFGQDYLAEAGCMLGPMKTYSWVARLLRSPGKESDPIRHLLILRSLGLSVEDLVEESKMTFNHPAIDDSKVVCLNPVCPHYNTSFRKQTRIFTSKETRREMAQFTCACCDQTIERCLEILDEPIRYRIIDRGRLWEKELTTLWSRSDLSLRQVAVKLGAESLTVKRHGQRLSLPFPRVGLRLCKVVPKIAQPVQGPTEQEMADRKGQWREAVKLKGTTKEARKIANAAYSWLYRNDRGWLVENSPARRLISRHAQIDWAAREAVLLSKVDDAFLKITRRTPPQLCSIKAMLIEINGVRYEKFLDKMPTLTGRLRELAETYLGFAIRRIEIAKKLLPPGAPPTQIMEAAKLKSVWRRVPLIREHLGALPSLPVALTSDGSQKN